MQTLDYEFLNFLWAAAIVPLFLGVVKILNLRKERLKKEKEDEERAKTLISRVIVLEKELNQSKDLNKEMRKDFSDLAKEINFVSKNLDTQINNFLISMLKNNTPGTL